MPHAAVGTVQVPLVTQVLSFFVPAPADAVQPAAAEIAFSDVLGEVTTPEQDAPQTGKDEPDGEPEQQASVPMWIPVFPSPLWIECARPAISQRDGAGVVPQVEAQPEVPQVSMQPPQAAAEAEPGVAVEFAGAVVEMAPRTNAPDAPVMEESERPPEAPAAAPVQPRVEGFTVDPFDSAAAEEPAPEASPRLPLPGRHEATATELPEPVDIDLTEAAVVKAEGQPIENTVVPAPMAEVQVNSPVRDTAPPLPRQEPSISRGVEPRPRVAWSSGFAWPSRAAETDWAEPHTHVAPGSSEAQRSAQTPHIPAFELHATPDAPSQTPAAPPDESQLKNTAAPEVDEPAPALEPMVEQSEARPPVPEPLPQAEARPVMSEAVRPQPREAAPVKTEAPRPPGPAWLEPPEKPTSTAPVREMTVRIDSGEPDQAVAVRFRQTSEGIDIGVRASQPDVAQVLQRDLPDLVEGLRREGFRADLTSATPSERVQGSSEAARDSSTLEGESGRHKHELEDWPEQRHRRSRPPYEVEDDDQ